MLNATLLALTLTLGAGETRPPVLLELFTSEACENCPRQEEVLARLAKEQPVEGVELIPLAFHMDAYDELGWKDRYGTEEATRRHRRYNAVHNHGKVFPPHMVVDGERSFFADEEKARAQVAAAAKRWRKAPVRLTVRTEKDEVVLKVQLDAKPAEETEVWAALAEDGLRMKVTSGPNKGRTLAHAATVRTWRVLPEPKPEGDGYATEVRLKLGRGWKRDQLRAVVALQKPWGGRVQGLASARLGKKD
jgi:hypothetical protein